MAKTRIQINGLAKVVAMANKYPAQSQKYIDQAIVRSIGEIDINVKPITPVKTGRLRNSMVPIFSPFKGVYGARVNYAGRVHNLYSAGTPYKNPSLNKSAVAGFLTVGVRQSLQKIQEEFAWALQQIGYAITK